MESGHRAVDGPVGSLDPASTVPEPPRPAEAGVEPVPEAVWRTDLRRARQAVLGRSAGADAARFAAEVARAVSDERPVAAPLTDAAGPEEPPMAGASAAVVRSGAHSRERGETVTGVVQVLPASARATAVESLPALRAAVFGPPTPHVDPHRAATLSLPESPAAVCDRDGRVVRANDALLRLAGDGADLVGRDLSEVVVGPDADARLGHADGPRVRVVRWEPDGQRLSIVILVELADAGADEAAPDGAADLSWTEELERLARVGTWSYELAAASLHRSVTLDELYRSVGLDPDTATPEQQLIDAFVEALQNGDPVAGRHVELRLPHEVKLSFRAEVEYTADGAPVRLVGVARDVSAQRLADERVRRSGQRFSDLMALLPGGVALLDEGGRVVEANAGMGVLLDVAPARLRGVPAPLLAADSPGGTAWPSWLRGVAPGAQYGYHVDAAPLRRGDGTTVWCDLDVAVTIADDGGRFWLVVATDVTDRRRMAEVLRSAGTVDELTRLPNRTACLDLLDRLIAGPSRDDIAVVCGGLDGFQRVNSALGHEAGDDLLVTLAARLQRDLPFGCTAARLSGDEFVVICSDHTEVGGPDQLARVVADLLRTTVTVGDVPVPLTATVGIATPIPSGTADAADLLRFAEVAMHDAKHRQSGGGIGVATDGVVSSAERALELEAELRATIATDGLVLEYQPVAGPDGRVLSVEALVRWPHPARGTIPPADFLPVAQRCGLLRELDLWVLRTATAEAASWPAPDGVAPAIAVNLAGLLPGDPDFSDAVTEAVTSAGLAWDRLVLELVETSLVALPPHALAAMQGLTRRGVRFAVDDFGTGYSSLARLKELPAQIVKIDRAFVTGVAENPMDFAVARAVVDMCRAMDRTTVAEGVETPEQFHVLRGIGVDAYQGWLFSHAVPPEQVRELLAGGRLETPTAALQP